MIDRRTSKSPRDTAVYTYMAICFIFYFILFYILCLIRNNERFRRLIYQTSDRLKLTYGYGKKSLPRNYFPSSSIRKFHQWVVRKTWLVIHLFKDARLFVLPQCNFNEFFSGRCWTVLSHDPRSFKWERLYWTSIKVGRERQRYVYARARACM